MGLILTLILLLVLLAILPSWPYSRAWGYGPSGIAAVLLVVLIVLILMGGPITWWGPTTPLDRPAPVVVP